MNDPYVYPHTNILRNLASIQDDKKLSCMEAEYTSIRLAEHVLDKMDQYTWETVSLEEAAWTFSKYIAELWKVHPYREGNTRTIITFCSQFIESKGFYIDSDLLKDNAPYVRTALVAATAIFSDLGDKRKPEYLDRIILDALQNGQEMKIRISDMINKAGYKATEKRIRQVVYWNRYEKFEHDIQAIKLYLSQKETTDR